MLSVKPITKKYLAKRVIVSGFLMLTIGLIVLLIPACNKNNTSTSVWKYKRIISSPIKAVGGAKTTVTLGNIPTHAVKLHIPKNSFFQDKKISLSTPKTVPDYQSNEIEPLESPIEISGRGVTRLERQAVITMKFNPKSLSKKEDASYLRVIYYNGKKWEYLKPLSVDMEKGLITFGTYHFSILGIAKVKDETKLTEQWIHSQALDNELRKKINNTSDFVIKQIIEQTLDKLGVDNKSVTYKVVTDLLTSDGDTLRDMYETAKKGQQEEAYQKMMVYMGTLISRSIPKGAVQNAMNHVTGNADDIAAVSKALGYAAGGQYKDAAKIIGETISDKFLVTTAAKIAVETVDYQINSWKNSEIEAAYKAYKDGADAKFWGYNVDAGNFDAVWNQMRGIRRQLELEAVKKERRIRKEAGMPPLTAQREAIIRQSVKESYRRQFKERLKHEAAIKKEEAKLKPLIEAYKKANLLSDTLGPIGLDKGFTYEEKLNLLYKFAEKMMRDTGRPDFKNLKGIRPKKALLISDIIIGAKLYFGKNGKKRYLAYIKKEFGQEDNNLPRLKLRIERKGYFGGIYLKIPIVINNKVTATTLPANITITRNYDMHKLQGGSSGGAPELVTEKAEFHGTYNLKTGTLSGNLTYNANVKFLTAGGKVGALAKYSESGKVQAKLNQITTTINGKIIAGQAKQHREFLIANDQGFKPEPSDDSWSGGFKVYGKLPKGL